MSGSTKKYMVQNSSLSPYEDEPYPDFTQIASVRIAFVVVYVLVMLSALLGNSAVCSTVFKNKKMHTAVNYYIVNLAVCDFLVGAFVLPVKLLELTSPSSWGIFNDALCTSMMFLQTIVVFASVLTLVAICVERYMAVVHPLESRMQQTKKRAKRIIFIAWLAPCIVASPFLYPWKVFTNTLESVYGSISRISCFSEFSEAFRRSYYTFLFIFMYIVPLAFIGVTCFLVAQCLLKDIPVNRQGSIRRREANRRKVAKMVIVVVIAFALTWTPYFLVTIVTQYQEVNFMERENFFFTMLCINLFAFTNSCINPFIYGAMSARFRHGFLHFFYSVCFCFKFNSSTAERNTFVPSREAMPSRGSRQQFRCAIPNLCVVPGTSSDNSNECHSESFQHFSITSESHGVHKCFSLQSVFKTHKCRMIAEYVSKNMESQVYVKAKSARQKHNAVKIEKTTLFTDLAPDLPSLETPKFSGSCKTSVSVGDIPLIHQESLRGYATKDGEEHIPIKWLSCVEFTQK